MYWLKIVRKFYRIAPKLLYTVIIFLAGCGCAELVHNGHVSLALVVTLYVCMFLDVVMRPYFPPVLGLKKTEVTEETCDKLLNLLHGYKYSSSSGRTATADELELIRVRCLQLIHKHIRGVPGCEKLHLRRAPSRVVFDTQVTVNEAYRRKKGKMFIDGFSVQCMSTCFVSSDIPPYEVFATCLHELVHDYTPDESECEFITAWLLSRSDEPRAYSSAIQRLLQFSHILAEHAETSSPYVDSPCYLPADFDLPSVCEVAARSDHESVCSPRQPTL